MAEGAEAPVTDPTVDQLTITVAKAVGLTVITNELSQDSSPAALQVVGDGLLRDLIRVVDKAFFANTTTNGPAGLLSITPTTADAGDSWSNLDAFEFAKSNAEQHNTTVDTFVANPATALKLATLKQFGTAGSNVPLLAPDPTAPASRVIAGVPLLTSPTIANDIVWGPAEGADHRGAARRRGSRAGPVSILHELENRYKSHDQDLLGLPRPSGDLQDRGHAMTKRTVAQPLTSYVGADGSVRYAAAGDEVDVHADHVKRFDAVDSTAQERTEAQQDATPKQPAKKATTAKRRA